MNIALCTANITSPLYTSSTEPITHIVFREFIKLTNLKSIKHFLITAAFTPEGWNLEYLWDRAFEEGCTAGRCLLVQTLEKKLEEAFNDGYQRGFKEGQSSKVKLFSKGMKEGCADERSKWVTDGHSQYCFMPAHIFEDSGIQTDPTPVPTTNACTQTDLSTLQTILEQSTTPQPSHRAYI